MKRYFLLGIVILITVGVLNNCGSSSIAPNNTDENDESDETGGPATATIYNDITDFSKWSAFDPGENGVGSDPDGYVGGAFDGRYIYFAPDNNGTARHGEVLRFDTEGDFTGADSWTTYNPHADGVGTHGVGFRGAVFDGRYVYFAPCQTSTSIHAEVMRYDTEAEFQSASSWSVFDMRVSGLGAKLGMFHGAVFDGKYVYFVPFKNLTNTYTSVVVRYNTEEPFTSASSWSIFDPSANGVGVSPKGYWGGVFDGRYITFIPHYNGSKYHAEALKYDTFGTFDSADSWSAYDPTENGLGTYAQGYHGGIFDGRYIYFIPGYYGESYIGPQNHHGEILRFEAKTPASVPETVYGGSFF